MKDFILKRWFFILLTVVLWLKIYVVQRTYFKLDIENGLQEFIQLLTPLSAVILSLGIAAAIFKRFRTPALLFVYFFMTAILYANVVYYRFFDDFITMPLLFQGENMGDLGGSIKGLIDIKDIWMFIDVFILIAVSIFAKHNTREMKRVNGLIAILIAIGVFIINTMIAQTERPQLLTRTFDREMLVRFMGIHNYHVYDAVLFGRTKVQKAMAKQEDFAVLEHELKQEEHPINKTMTGVAKNMNVLVVSFESMQTFPINRQVNGQEITPFLNDFIKDSYYFDNFYHQTEQGKTSDAEFIIDNSLYGLPSGAVFFTHGQNEYHATPEILKQHGYTTSVMHANNKSFWNRDVIYPQLGYDTYYDEDYYTVKKADAVNWGLTDIPFFHQSTDLLKNKVKQPFYNKLIMLTNHYPFTLNEKDIMIPEYTSNSGTLNRYVQTVRYSDEAFKNLIQDLKDKGLYDNTVLVIYGDHYGISRNHDKAMGNFLGLGRNINDIESTQLQRVPLIIHVPGQKGKTLHKVTGQIDIKPTILNLLGINNAKDIYFGEDMLAENKDSAISMRDGRIVTSNYTSIDTKCYSNKWQYEVSTSRCEPYKEQSQKDLKHSDNIIYGDLFRFFDEARRDKETK
ncbi:hypothetical protein CN918_32125 [Priestia megaterium]|nr:hypothetical protein CN918_32125 [Priestia megaterium]